MLKLTLKIIIEMNGIGNKCCKAVDIEMKININDFAYI